MSCNENKKQGPKTAWFALTEACNNRCNWCYEGKNSYTGSSRGANVANRITCDEIQRVVYTLKECGLQRAILIGGEPTLHPEIHEIISFCSSHELEVTLVTNGRSASNPAFAKRLADAALKQATVSLHGWSPESYEGLGETTEHFRQATLGFMNLNKIGIRTGATLVLGHHTITQATSILDYIKHLDIKHIRFNVAVPAVSPSGIDGSYTASMPDMAHHVVEMFNRCTIEGIHSSFQLNLPFCLFDSADLKMLLDADAIRQSCHVRNGGGIVIRPNLNVAICTHLMEFPLNDCEGSKVFSDKETFLSFWRTDQLQNIRSKANSFRRPECIDCSWWQQCGGGCLVHWTYHDPITFEVNSKFVS